MTYGHKVRMIRTDMDMSLREFAKLTKVSKPTLCRIENENYDAIPLKQLGKIAEATKTTIEYFVEPNMKELPTEVVQFIMKPESKPYIIKAYYQYKIDTTK